MENKSIYLRPVEPEDASLLVIWENNPENWRVSGTEAPFSYHAIREYINSIQSFRESKELRLMICMKVSNRPIGTLDLFDANFKHGRAHIGILIADEFERGKGFAKEAIQLLITYASEYLDFHNLSANVLEDNIASIKVFEASGFELVGVRKEWFKDKSKRVNERIYQLCLRK
jgi:diamine N-acetyltransferase